MSRDDKSPCPHRLSGVPEVEFVVFWLKSRPEWDWGFAVARRSDNTDSRDLINQQHIDIPIEGVDQFRDMANNLSLGIIPSFGVVIP